MNRENIIQSANYELVAKYLSIDASTVKNYFNSKMFNTKREITNPEDLAKFIDKYELNGPGIYSIENIVNGRKYIWQSIILSERKKQHFHLLRTKKHQNKELQNDYNIFWKDSFTFTVLERVKDTKELLEKEKKYISMYDRTIVYNYISIFTKQNFEFFTKCLDRKEEIERFLNKA